jgi:hypothetical protein
MLSFKDAELLTNLVQELASTLPIGWRKLAFYQEIYNDKKLGFTRNKSTERCWFKNSKKEAYGFSLEITLEAFNILEKLHENSVENGDEWCGLLLVINENGKYSADFFYEATPLLDGDYKKVDMIIMDKAL